MNQLFDRIYSWSHLIHLTGKDPKVRGQAAGGCSRAVLSWHVLPWHWICSPIRLRVPGMVAVPGMWPGAGGKRCSMSHGQLDPLSPASLRPPCLATEPCSFRWETLKAWTFLYDFAVKKNVEMSEMPLDWKSRILALCGREIGLWT